MAGHVTRDRFRRQVKKAHGMTNRIWLWTFEHVYMREEWDKYEKENIIAKCQKGAPRAFPVTVGNVEEK